MVAETSFAVMQNATKHEGWRLLEQARASFLACDFPSTAKYLHLIVALASRGQDKTLMIEAAVLWRECRVRSHCQELAIDCFELGRAAQPLDLRDYSQS